MAVLTHVIAVIGGEENDGVLRKPQLFERIQHPADLGIREGRRGIVRLDRPAGQIVGEIHLLLLSRDRLAGRNGQRVQIAFRGSRQDNPLARIHVEIPLRCHIGRVRPIEADGQEERRPLGGIGLQELDCRGRPDAIGLLFVGAVRRQPTERAAKPAGDEAEDDRLVIFVAAAGIDLVVPRVGVVVPVGADGGRHSVVVDLAHAVGRVTVLAEQLRERHHVRKPLADADRVAPDERLIRIQPGHEGSPARTAERILAVRTFEANPPGSQTVDVGRLHHPMAVTAEIAVEVVANQKQHVGPGSGLRTIGGDQRCAHQVEDQRCTDQEFVVHHE